MWRRAWPYVFAVVLALGALGEVSSRPVPEGPGPMPLVMLIALGSTLPVALLRVQPAAALALPVVVLAFGRLAGVVPPVAGLVALAVALGHLGVRVVRTARDRAVRRNVEDRELRASLLDHVARGERARIAHELHDVVAHHISMIAVQAEAARLTVPGMPPEGAKRLLGIGDTARAALTEMRRLLGVLREDAGHDDPRRPQPGLVQLAELLDEARGLAGASTRLIVRGRVAPLDPGLELTAYRIVQEALTNARRHAPGAAVDVELDYREDAVHLRIRDNGPGPADATGAGAGPAGHGPARNGPAGHGPTGPGLAGQGSAGPGLAGHGLAGMRERAAAVGGKVTTGTGRAGGFVVEAVLPREGGAA
jgi:signal transduction histidine kinase